MEGGTEAGDYDDYDYDDAGEGYDGEYHSAYPGYDAGGYSHDAYYAGGDDAYYAAGGEEDPSGSYTGVPLAVEPPAPEEVTDRAKAMLRPMFNTVSHWSGGESAVDKMLLSMMVSMPEEGRRAAIVCRSDGGQTVLQAASQAHCVPAVHTLLEWGCNPRDVDKWGATPMHLACATPSDDTPEILQALTGACDATGSPLDLDATDARGCTALHYAAGAGDTGAVKLLLHKGASPTVQDVDGYTPEFYAAQTGAEDCVFAISTRAYEIAHSATEAEAQATLAAAHDTEERIVDPDSGHAYYMNTRTGETRWETDHDYEQFMAQKRHDTLKERRLELAARRREADRREAVVEERERLKHERQDDAMNYFSSLVKSHIAPQESQLRAAEERKYAAEKAQASARTREAKMRAKEAEAAKLDVELRRAADAERASREELEAKRAEMDAEAWWQKEKQAILEERRAAREEAKAREVAAASEATEAEADVRRLQELVEEKAAQDAVERAAAAPEEKKTSEEIRTAMESERWERFKADAEAAEAAKVAAEAEAKAAKAAQAEAEARLAALEAAPSPGKDDAVREVVEPVASPGQEVAKVETKPEAAVDGFSDSPPRPQAAVVTTPAAVTPAAATVGSGGPPDPSPGYSEAPTASPEAATPASPAVAAASLQPSEASPQHVEASPEPPVASPQPVTSPAPSPPAAPASSPSPEPTPAAASPSPSPEKPSTPAPALVPAPAAPASPLPKREPTPSPEPVPPAAAPSPSPSPSPKRVPAASSPVKASTPSPVKASPSPAKASPVKASPSPAKASPVKASPVKASSPVKAAPFPVKASTVKASPVKASSPAKASPSRGSPEKPPSSPAKAPRSPAKTPKAAALRSPTASSPSYSSPAMYSPKKQHPPKPQPSSELSALEDNSYANDGFESEEEPPPAPAPAAPSDDYDDDDFEAEDAKVPHATPVRVTRRTPASSDSDSDRQRPQSAQGKARRRRRPNRPSPSPVRVAHTAAGKPGRGKSRRPRRRRSKPAVAKAWGKPANSGSSPPLPRRAASAPFQSPVRSPSPSSSSPVRRSRRASLQRGSKPAAAASPPRPHTAAVHGRSPVDRSRAQALLRVWRQAAWRIGAKKANQRRLSEAQAELQVQRAALDRMVTKLDRTDGNLEAAAVDTEEALHRTNLRLAEEAIRVATADTRAQGAAETRVRKVVMHAQESNYTLWAALSREQALRREGHDRLEMMRGPVRVHCRIRPLTSAERSRGFVPVVRCLPSGIVELRPLAARTSVAKPTLKPKPRWFQYDAVYTPDCPQHHLFDDVRPLVQSAVDGHSTAVFCFGPERSGKTYTMFGHEATAIAGELGERAAGVAQRAGRELFRLLALEGGDMRAQDVDFVPKGRVLGGEEVRPNTAPHHRRRHTGAPPAQDGRTRRVSAEAGARHVGAATQPSAAWGERPAASPLQTGRPGTADAITPLGLQLGDWVSGTGDRVASGGGGASAAHVGATGAVPTKGWVEWGHFGLQAKVRMNVLEVRGNLVYDMLRKGSTPAVPLKLRMSAEGTSAVQDAVGVVVTSPQQFGEVVRSGLKRCHPRPKTSHLVIRVVVQVRRELDGLQRRGKLLLVDLATPERVLRPGLTPEQVDDVRDVAVSLYRLGEVLTGVARGDERVPYMMHTLTQLTYDCVASGKAMLVTHANPTSAGQSESERAMRFAAKIKSAKASQQAALLVREGGGEGEAGGGEPRRRRRRPSSARRRHVK